MSEGELGLAELESKLVFLVGLAEKSGNPFFHHGIYRGEVKDDMLIFNGSIFLSSIKANVVILLEDYRRKAF